MTVQVCYLPNGLLPHQRVLREVTPCSMASLAPTDWHCPFLAFVDGQVLLRADWGQALQAGQSVLFMDARGIPQGGGGGSDPLRTVLMLAVLVATQGMGTALVGAEFGVLAGTGLSAGVVQAGITVAGMALVSAVLPPPQRPSTQSSAALAAASPTYSLQAQGNAARLESAIPEHFGRLVAYPDFAALPYAEFDGNEQYLYQLLCIGRGAYDIEEIRIEDTPIKNFDGINYQIVQPNQNLTLFPASVNTSVEVAGQTLVNRQSTLSAGPQLNLAAHGFSVGDPVNVFIFTADVETVVTAVLGPNDFRVANPGNQIQGIGPVGVSQWLGPFVANAAGTLANYLSLDFVAPQGLYVALDNGSLAASGALLKVEGRQIDDEGNALEPWRNLTEFQYVAPDDPQYSSAIYGPWSSWTFGGFGNVVPPDSNVDQYLVDRSGRYYSERHRTVNYVGQQAYQKLYATSTTPQRYSIRYRVAPGRYEVRVRRVDYENLNPRVADTFLWSSMRAYLNDSRTFGDVTLLALRMKASNSLSTQSSRKINVIATRKLRSAGFTEPTITPTRSLAAALLYCARSVGLTSAQIDLTALAQLDATWTARGDYFDGRFDNFLGFWEAISKIAGAGRAKPYMQAGVLRFMRDQASAIPVALFNMRNIVKNSFSIQYLMPTAETADAVNVGFFDESNWAPAVVQARLPLLPGDPLLAVRPVKVDLFGVTQREQAHREGMYLAAVNRYRRKIITLNTEMDGFIPSLGDLVAIQHDMPAWGQGGDIIDIADTPGNPGSFTFTLSEDLQWQAASAHYLLITKSDGTLFGPYLATQGGQADQAIVVSSDPDFATGVQLRLEWVEAGRYAFGWAQNTVQQARVISVKPMGLYQVALQCINEDPSVHSADQGVVLPPVVTTQLANYTNAPVVSGVTVTPMLYQSNILLVSWEPALWADYYVIEQSSDGINWTSGGRTGSTSVNINGLYGATTLVRVAAVGLAKGPWSYSTAVTLDATPPPLSPVVSAVGGLFCVHLAWTFGDTIKTRAMTEIWWSATNDFERRVLLSQVAFPGTTFVHMALAAGSSHYYWLRVVDTLQHASPYSPDPSLGGLFAQTINDPDLLLQALLDSLDVDQLTANLRSKIDLIDGQGGLITTLQNTTATSADLIDQVQVRLDSGDYAAIKQSSLVSSNALGVLNARHTLQLDVNGHVSGTESVNDGAISSFTILADKFLVARPDNQGVPVAMFGATTLNGVTTVGINGDLIVTNSIKASAIDTRELTIKDANGNVILSAGTQIVGGANLLANSGNFTLGSPPWTSLGSQVFYNFLLRYGDWYTLQIEGQGGAYNPQNARLKPNTTYTVSAMVIGSDTTVDGYDQSLHIQNWSDENPTNVHQEIPGAHDTAVGTIWKKIWQTFTTCDSANLTYCRMFFHPLRAGLTINVGYIKIEEGTFATDYNIGPDEVTTKNINTVNLANRKLDSEVNGILSATISLNAVSGAGFKAGSLQWDSYGNRISGNGVAMTPGGIIAYNSTGKLAFSLNAATGSAYFAGDLAADTASFDSIVSSSATSFDQASFGCPNGVWVPIAFYMHHYGYVSVIATGTYSAQGTSGNSTVDLGYNYTVFNVEPINSTGAITNYTNTGPRQPNTLMISAYFNEGLHHIYYKLYESNTNGTHVGSVAIFKSYR